MRMQAWGAVVVCLGLILTLESPALATRPNPLATPANATLHQSVSLLEGQDSFRLTTGPRYGPQATVKPAGLPVTIPDNASVVIGTGDGSNADNAYDYNEASSRLQSGTTTYDRYLVLETDTSSYYAYKGVTVDWWTTCGPTATHNALTHFGTAPDVLTLADQEYTAYTPNNQNGTDWGNAFAILYGYAKPYYQYDQTQFNSSSISAWEQMFNDAAATIGIGEVPTMLSLDGQLPDFQETVAHYVVPYGYSGYYASTDSSKYIDYFDSWMGNDTTVDPAHWGNYWFSEPISYMSSENILVENLAY